jgi:hypothetical protein
LSATSKQALAKRLMWAARILLLLITIFVIMAVIGPAIDSIMHGMGYKFDSESITAVIIAAMVSVIFIISWWRGWFSGIMLILLSLYFYWIVFLSLPLLITGALFLISWWLTRKSKPPAEPNSPT